MNTNPEKEAEQHPLILERSVKVNTVRLVLVQVSKNRGNVKKH